MVRFLGTISLLDWFSFFVGANINEPYLISLVVWEPPPSSFQALLF